MNRKFKSVMLMAMAVITFSSCNGQSCCNGKGKSCSPTCSTKTISKTDTTKTLSSIQFFKGTYEEALASAIAQNKMLFIDAYAVWCGPCKMLDKKTFTDSSVIAYLNTNFISYKFDVEKDTGIQLAEKLKIKEYPTLLIVESNEKVLSKAIGYKSPVELISWLKTNIK